MEFKTVEHDILPILREKAETRCDDMLLYACYAYRKAASSVYNPAQSTMLLNVFLDARYRIHLGVAPYETVSRVRRKLQEKHAELRATKEQIQEKQRAEREYKRYARERGANHE